ncbi:MAG: hypothetical protein NUV77_04905, partial [Thermoguttaceae bacterium]|nr:hypothetical protein [Thermoguttaceae bacterium]
QASQACAVVMAWAERLEPDSAETCLIRAACFRQLKQVRPFVEALEAAAQKGAPAARIEEERGLGLIQAGRIEAGAESQLARWIEAGLWPHDVAAAFVWGLLVRGQPEEARKVLDAWASDFPHEAHVAYMRGAYWQWLGDQDAAEREFRLALARQPRHEPARAALAELLEGQDRLVEAFEQYAEWARESPGNE